MSCISKNTDFAGHRSPQSRRNLLSENKINGFDHDLDVPFVNLRRNYRSHTAILAPASLMCEFFLVYSRRQAERSEVYDDTLLPCAVDSIVQSPLGKWPGLPRPVITLLLLHLLLMSCIGLPSRLPR